MMMRIKKYRYFGGMLAAQEKWLGRMAQKGYRLAATGTAAYEFSRASRGRCSTKWNSSAICRSSARRTIAAFCRIWATVCFIKI